ncbi:cofactor-independent phosphoglycerate mutase [Ruminococcus sp. YE282]|jgi:2,3-bisphosphoglycerate-independent phosphoglycerate mutase|uniref:cofactor-independent phosphoglycerate mutase n=1 Tax=Ruminococcus sp. YE282 TaxID=3158780 RepID=UPI000882AE31|nr:cofactor-independent phosphoglycerate mutase [Ruminococcus bromii]SCX75132.1 2,3-bisphosphoglycerate-independent phosphoglycerate mutase [Ruminococcus bromii]
MKYLVMLCDGMADEPNEALGGVTPMEKADKPCMDSLAAKAEVGMVKTVAEGLKPGSDVANLSVLGYEPAVYYSGRSPLEAVSIGIDLSETDVTLRCNLVTLSDEPEYSDKTMVDYCGGDISTPEAKELIDYIQKNLGDDTFSFYPGVSYRHCLVWKNGNPHPGELTPPHDISNRVIKDYIPKGDDTAKLYDLMKKSYDLLKDHPINKKRVAEGKRPANSIWLWGEGTKPKLDTFFKKFGKKGSMISAVDLLKGIAICAGMNSVDVDGATGYIDTNFDGKCQAAINEFKNGSDLVYIHVEAPDECGHRGEAENKVKAIEMIDKHILGPVTEFLKSYDDFAVLVCPDHPTPLAIKTHTSNPVPYLIYDSKNPVDSKVTCFCEKQAKETGNYIAKGFTMMNHFLSK